MPFERALALVVDAARALHAPQAVRVKLPEALGRYLAEDIRADRDFPPFPRATRDGYAFAGPAEAGSRFKLAGQVKAGESFPRPLAIGECVEIMTGAPVPEGANCVLMVEYSLQPSPDEVECGRAVKAGENVVATGSEARAGDLVVAKGERVSHSQVAVLASVGCTQVSVARRPRVAILPTGDEIVEIDQTPSPAQIRNSNSYSLAAQCVEQGCEPWQLGIAPDEPNALRGLIEQGLTGADLLLLSGGVSMGRFDLVEPALAALGAEFIFTGVAIQPGRPLVFGSVPQGGERKYFFGLPGNPVSTMATFHLFVRPMLAAMSGGVAAAPSFLHGRLAKDVQTRTGLTRFLPAVYRGDYGDATVELVAWQGSGDVAAMARANCYAVLAPDRERFSAGEWIPLVLKNG